MKADDLSQHWHMCLADATPREVYLRAKAAGLGDIACIRLLRTLFPLSLVEAKEVVITADGGVSSLLEHQKNLLADLEAILGEEAFPEKTP